MFIADWTQSITMKKNCTSVCCQLARSTSFFRIRQFPLGNVFMFCSIWMSMKTITNKSIIRSIYIHISSYCEHPPALFPMASQTISKKQVMFNKNLPFQFRVNIEAFLNLILDFLNLILHFHSFTTCFTGHCTNGKRETSTYMLHKYNLRLVLIYHFVKGEKNHFRKKTIPRGLQLILHILYHILFLFTDCDLQDDAASLPWQWYYRPVAINFGDIQSV